jgi:hypothetical protein
MKNWKKQMERQSNEEILEDIAYMEEMNSLQEIPSFVEAISYGHTVMERRARHWAGNNPQESDRLFNYLLVDELDELEPDRDMIRRYAESLGYRFDEELIDLIVTDVKEAAHNRPAF